MIITTLQEQAGFKISSLISKNCKMFNVSCKTSLQVGQSQNISSLNAFGSSLLAPEIEQKILSHLTTFITSSDLFGTRFRDRTETRKPVVKRGTTTPPLKRESGLRGFSTNLRAKRSFAFSGFLTGYKLHHEKRGGVEIRLPSENFLEWFVGFTEGDGSFSITKRGDIAFVITQSQDNISLLEQIKQIFGFGSVLKQGKRVYRYIVQRQDELALIIELFNGNLVLPSRKTQFQQFFLKWKEKHVKRDERKKVRKLTCPISILGKTADGRWESLTDSDRRTENESRRKDYLNKRNMPSLDTLWLLGFVEAEGCFTISLLSNSTAFRTRFVVSQKGDENIPVLSLLISLFGVGKIEGHSAKGNYSYIVSGLKNVKKIYGYFDQNIDSFVGIKKQSYLKWKALNGVLKKKGHLEKEERNLCAERAKEINKVSRKSK